MTCQIHTVDAHEVDEVETDDPALKGEMTITITLADANGGTEIRAIHEGVPPGVSPVDNEKGWATALLPRKVN